MRTVYLLGLGVAMLFGAGVALDGRQGNPRNAPASLAPFITTMTSIYWNTNMRHVEASHVEINLQCRDGQLYVTVVDDGIGFSPDRHKKETSLGLVGIEERIDALGGRFSITNNSAGA